jgi:hypothetical protein
LPDLSRYGNTAGVTVTHDAADARDLSDADPESILEGLNESIARKMPSYDDLYRRWERLNWRVSDLDFRRDREDWLALDQLHKDRLLWTLAAFFVAEERVAATLTPYVRAAPKFEQKIFLATQCVDESRHAVFFDRWFEEVVAAGDGDLAARLRSSRQWVGPGFEPLFDDYLVDVTTKLWEDPDDIRLFAKAIAVYHIVIEGVLALSGQKFILEWARKNEILPGFRTGFTAVARDESRHVSFGARVIRDLLEEDPSLIEPIHEGIRETLRLGTWLYQPPNGDLTYTSAFGYSLTDLFNYGGLQLEKKMRAIGIPMPDVDIAIPPIDAQWPPPGGGLIAEHWRQEIPMVALRALGRLNPWLAPGVSVMMLYLGFMPPAARGINAVYEFDLRGRGGGTFTIVIEDGNCRIVIGRTDKEPDVVYEMEARTWLEMAAGLATGDEAALLGRIRIRGDVELARRFNEFFAPPGDPPIRTATRPNESTPRFAGWLFSPVVRFGRRVSGLRSGIRAA